MDSISVELIPNLRFYFNRTQERITPVMDRWFVLTFKHEWQIIIVEVARCINYSYEGDSAIDLGILMVKWTLCYRPAQAPPKAPTPTEMSRAHIRLTPTSPAPPAVRPGVISPAPVAMAPPPPLAPKPVPVVSYVRPEDAK